MNLSLEEIDEYTRAMEKDSKALKDELYRFCWYMRGGLSFSEAFELSIDDKEIISKIIEDNLTMTKESKLPFF